MGRVSTLPLLLHKVMCQLPSLESPSFFSLPRLSLPLQPQFHLHLQFQLSPLLGRSHSPTPRPPPTLLVPLLTGGLIHHSVLRAQPLALELVQCTTSQELLWLKEMLLWAGTEVPKPPLQGLQVPMGRLQLSARQRVLLLCVVPHLWLAVHQARTGKKGIVV